MNLLDKFKVGLAKSSKKFSVGFKDLFSKKKNGSKFTRSI